MVDDPDNLVLAHLRAIRAGQDDMREQLRNLTLRVGKIEIAIAQSQVAFAELGVRMDRIEARIERIERRLDLVDAGP